MQKARIEFAIRIAAIGLTLWGILITPGCVNLVTKPFKLYDGPILPRDKIAVLFYVLNVQVNVDDKENVNPDSHTWGGRYEILPGTHRIGIRPYVSFVMGAAHEHASELLPEDALYFDAEAGKEYHVGTEHFDYDQAKIGESGNKAKFIVSNINIKFFIMEKKTKLKVSRRTN